MMIHAALGSFGKVHPGDATHSHGAEVPDFPGCFSAADDWQDLPRRVQEAVEVWCMGEDMDLPAPMAPLAAVFWPRLRDRR